MPMCFIVTACSQSILYWDWCSDFIWFCHVGGSLQVLSKDFIPIMTQLLVKTQHKNECIDLFWQLKIPVGISNWGWVLITIFFEHEAQNSFFSVHHLALRSLWLSVNTETTKGSWKRIDLLVESTDGNHFLCLLQTSQTSSNPHISSDDTWIYIYQTKTKIK